MLKRLLLLSTVVVSVSASADMAITVDCCAETETKKSNRCAKFVVSEEPVADIAAACDRPALQFGERAATVSVDPSEDDVTISLAIAEHVKLDSQTVAWGHPAVFTCSETGETVRIIVERT